MLPIWIPWKWVFSHFEFINEIKIKYLYPEKRHDHFPKKKKKACSYFLFLFIFTLIVGIKGMLPYQILYASLSVPNDMHIVCFQLLELLPLRQGTLPPDWQFHHVAWLPMRSSHSQLHSAALHWKRRKRETTLDLSLYEISSYG